MFILITNEAECQTCNLGEDCTVTDPGTADGAFCDPDKGISCYQNKCQCVDVEGITQTQKGDGCCSIPNSYCFLPKEQNNPYSYYLCCPKEECVYESESAQMGQCKCLKDYTYNATTKTCQKTAKYNETCDDDYDICGTNLLCDKSTNKCKCSNGLTYSDGECKTVSNTNSQTTNSNSQTTNSNTQTSNSNPQTLLTIEDESSSVSKFINFKILLFIAYLSIINL